MEFITCNNVSALHILLENPLQLQWRNNKAHCFNVIKSGWKKNIKTLVQAHQGLFISACKNKQSCVTCGFQRTSRGMSTANFLPINLEYAVSIFGIVQEECNLFSQVTYYSWTTLKIKATSTSKTSEGITNQHNITFQKSIIFTKSFSPSQDLYNTY